MRKSFFVISSLLIFGWVHAQNGKPSRTTTQQKRPETNREIRQYDVTISLYEYRDGLIPVEVRVPAMRQDTVIYSMPAIVPGTYKIYDFGRFVSDLQAYDAQGMPLQVIKSSVNQWKIYPGSKLSTIRYKAKETFSDESGKRIFEPAGSDYKDSVFLMNLFTSIGYVEGQHQMPYRLTVKRPSYLYGATSLPVISRGKDQDVFQGKNYFQIHDNPILYAVPDTASVRVKNAIISVAVYSPNNEVNARKAIDEMKAIFEAAADYLGGILPTDVYTVLLYLSSPENIFGAGFGALEHETSTVLYMPEFDGEEFYRYMNDIVAHEFLHIVTPLTLRSQYVHNFDFSHPKMSKHLWLYEGVTEYTSQLIQVRSGLIDVRDFLERMREKIVAMDNFNKYVPITTSSKYALDVYEDQYLNVYNKGAVLAMCLDLKLRSLSNGENGLGDVIHKLQKTYGRDTFFVDEDFFDVFAAHSFPEMKEFFARYFDAAEPLPLEELLKLSGITYKPTYSKRLPSFGGIRLNYNDERKTIYVSDTDDLDEFGKALGLKQGDEILSIQGMPLTIETFESTVMNYFNNTKEGDLVTFEINRPGKKNKYKKIMLKAKAVLLTIEQEHYLEPSENITEKEVEFRLKWLNQ
ncbi:MAG: hypothetical protein ACK4EX_05010 [Thermaurantimonas sp.]|uniref:M61 family metallopeptidase n=1 Tax=Thermaurantimonas sp. TaxID=2681568 RepID=UPI00391D37C1